MFCGLCEDGAKLLLRARTTRLLTVCYSSILLSLPALAAQAQQVLVVNPALPTAADELQIFLSVEHCSFHVSSAIQGNTIYLYPDTSRPCPSLPFPNPGLVTSVKLGPLSAGSYALTVVTDGQTTDSRVLFVQEPRTQLSLLQGRFAVSATFTSPDGTPRDAHAVQLGDASGYLWFFDKSDVELTVKMVSGFLINRRYWVFVSSATDVPFTLSIVDTWLCTPPTPSCPKRTYQGAAGSNRNFIDTSSFAYD
ncbi:MAG TPA: hypothetical protein VHR45_00015 [Thermoanaerobaculia bacterium]|nr:hypothetical protein [Thermoanaerobaculia bacterium]